MAGWYRKASAEKYYRMIRWDAVYTAFCGFLGHPWLRRIQTFNPPSPAITKHYRSFQIAHYKCSSIFQVLGSESYQNCACNISLLGHEINFPLRADIHTYIRTYIHTYVYDAIPDHDVILLAVSFFAFQRTGWLTNVSLSWSLVKGQHIAELLLPLCQKAFRQWLIT